MIPKQSGAYILYSSSASIKPWMNMTFTLWRGHKFLTRTVDTNQYIWTEGHIGSRFITVPEYWVVSLRRPVWIQSFRLLLHCFPVQVAFIWRYQTVGLKGARDNEGRVAGPVEREREMFLLFFIFLNTHLWFVSKFRAKKILVKSRSCRFTQPPFTETATYRPILISMRLNQL